MKANFFKSGKDKRGILGTKNSVFNLNITLTLYKFRPSFQFAKSKNQSIISLSSQWFKAKLRLG